MTSLRFQLDSSNFFCDHDGVVRLSDMANTVNYWDANVAYGELLKEKVTSFHVKLTELTLVMIRKGAKGLFWLVVSPEVLGMIETSANYRANTDNDQYPMGTDEVLEVGVLNRQWRIYVDPLLSHDTAIVGVGEEIDETGEYGLLKISNFVL